MSQYDCTCSASAGAPYHAVDCPAKGLDWASMNVKTEPQKPVRIRHPLVNIAEWRKGCSCAPKEFPVQCEACTEGLIRAIEGWFTQRNTRRGPVADNILQNLDDRAGAKVKGIAGDAATLIRELDAELYAAQDQVAGLQELMRTQRAPENLDVAVRHLVAAAEADDCHQGSPEHGHRLAGRWDGDNKHPKGSLCEECAAWDILRKYVAAAVAAPASTKTAQPVFEIKHGALGSDGTPTSYSFESLTDAGVENFPHRTRLYAHADVGEVAINAAVLGAQNLNTAMQTIDTLRAQLAELTHRAGDVVEGFDGEDLPGAMAMRVRKLKAALSTTAKPEADQ